MKIAVDTSDRTGDDVQERVFERVFGGSQLSSLQKTGSTHWGSPKDWYLSSGKFECEFATVDVDEWLSMHDAIGHSRQGAYQGTVDNVVESIEAGREGEIPTPPLELKPEEFGVHGQNPIVYEPVREGRSRAVGAKKAGVDTIPVLVAVRRPKR